MRRDRAWRRAVGMIVTAVLSCAGVQAAYALEGAGQREKLGFVSPIQGFWVALRSSLRLRIGDRIDAGTVELIKGYYQHLAAGQGHTASLRAVQLVMLHSGVDPYTLTSLVAYGAPGPLRE